MKNFFANLKIKYKICSITIIAVLCVISFSLAFLSSYRSSLIDEKKDKLRNVVETAYSVLVYNYNSFKAGTMSEDQAKASAIAALKTLRYNETDYFWINDNKLPYPAMIMHPTNPALDGKTLDDPKFNCATALQSGLKGTESGTDGKKNLFQAAVEVTNVSDAGFVSYVWPRPLPGGGVSEERYPKISFVKKFPEWNWIIGSGIYIDDVNAIFWNKAKMLGAVIAGFNILIALVGWFISKLISDPLSEISGKIEEMANGDLTVQIDYYSKDEAGSLARSMNL
ncbi:MAG: cache domain-containing protein, partial [Dissulfurispiraceae bacterium]